MLLTNSSPTTADADDESACARGGGEGAMPPTISSPITTDAYGEGACTRGGE